MFYFDPMQVDLLIDSVAPQSLNYFSFASVVYRWCWQVGCWMNGIFLSCLKIYALSLLMYLKLVACLTQMTHQLTLDNTFSCCKTYIKDEASWKNRPKEIGCQSFCLQQTFITTISLPVYCSAITS